MTTILLAAGLVAAILLGVVFYYALDWLSDL